MSIRSPLVGKTEYEKKPGIWTRQYKIRDSSCKWRFHLERCKSEKEEKGEEAAYIAKSSKVWTRIV
jgi:hypothetical protein